VSKRCQKGVEKLSKSYQKDLKRVGGGGEGEGEGEGDL
jgi:hypothetical protein